MRKIKFRKWDSENKTMINADDLAYEEYAPVSELLSYDSNIMQYTGLKDVSGKEIYEGDIVNMHYFYEGFDSQTLGSEERETNVIGIIKIIDCTLFVEDKESLYPVINYVEDPAAELEIIGNIYENPELLEG